MTLTSSILVFLDSPKTYEMRLHETKFQAPNNGKAELETGNPAGIDRLKTDDPVEPCFRSTFEVRTDQSKFNSGAPA